MKKTQFGLFSGIGGFEYAGKKCGFKIFAWSEIDPFCRTVLSYHFAEARAFGDVKKINYSKYASKIFILTGGFPCQPFSTAGRRRGTDDERYLWPEMLRAAKDLKVPWIVAENVRGLVNWSDGLVFEQVCSDLESEGYEVAPFLLPAAGVGAPHERYRVFFVAYSAENGYEYRKFGKNRSEEEKSAFIEKEREWIRLFLAGISPEGATTDTYGEGLAKRVQTRQRSIQQKEGKFKGGKPSRGDTANNWGQFPTQSPICSGDDGISSRLDGITFSNLRKESLKAYGNAIVPQVAMELFSLINEYELFIKGL